MSKGMQTQPIASVSGVWTVVELRLTVDIAVFTCRREARAKYTLCPDVHDRSHQGGCPENHVSNLSPPASLLAKGLALVALVKH